MDFVYSQSPWVLPKDPEGTEKIGSSRNSGKNYLKSNIALARKQTAASHLKRFLGQGIRD